jgi:capsular exopolysaccharide synthesis family protein
VLGSVPKVKQGDTLDELSDRKSAFFDAYLTIFTNLGFTTEHGVPRSLSVTSSRPGEGKSTSALSLATALSRAGRRTILVDGDMRSPSVHALVNAKNDRGLSNYLAGSENVDGLIDWANGFEIATMSAGPPPPNAAELLAGKRMSSLVEALLEKFDHVVIDSPPVMGLADAPLIGSHVEAVVYVIESQGSRLSLVKTAIGRMRLANAHIVGGILTKFKPRRSNYGYGYGYGQDESAEA